MLLIQAVLLLLFLRKISSISVEKNCNQNLFIIQFNINSFIVVHFDGLDG